MSAHMLCAQGALGPDVLYVACGLDPALCMLHSGLVLIQPVDWPKDPYPTAEPNEFDAPVLLSIYVPTRIAIPPCYYPSHIRFHILQQ